MKDVPILEIGEVQTILIRIRSRCSADYHKNALDFYIINQSSLGFNAKF
jgi:hypothetical protein